MPKFELNPHNVNAAYLKVMDVEDGVRSIDRFLNLLDFPAAKGTVTYNSMDRHIAARIGVSDYVTRRGHESTLCALKNYILAHCEFSTEPKDPTMPKFCLHRAEIEKAFMLARDFSDSLPEAQIRDFLNALHFDLPLGTDRLEDRIVSALGAPEFETWWTSREGTLLECVRSFFLDNCLKEQPVVTPPPPLFKTTRAEIKDAYVSALDPAGSMVEQQIARFLALLHFTLHSGDAPLPVRIGCTLRAPFEEYAKKNPKTPLLGTLVDFFNANCLDPIPAVERSIEKTELKETTTGLPPDLDTTQLPEPLSMEEAVMMGYAPLSEYLRLHMCCPHCGIGVHYSIRRIKGLVTLQGVVLVPTDHAIDAGALCKCGWSGKTDELVPDPRQDASATGEVNVKMQVSGTAVDRMKDASAAFKVQQKAKLLKRILDERARGHLVFGTSMSDLVDEIRSRTMEDLWKKEDGPVRDGLLDILLVLDYAAATAYRARSGSADVALQRLVEALTHISDPEDKLQLYPGPEAKEVQAAFAAARVIVNNQKG